KNIDPESVLAFRHGSQEEIARVSQYDQGLDHNHDHSHDDHDHDHGGLSFLSGNRPPPTPSSGELREEAEDAVRGPILPPRERLGPRRPAERATGLVELRN